MSDSLNSNAEQTYMKSMTRPSFLQKKNSFKLSLW